MPPSPIPAPLAPWAKWALRLAPFAVTYLESLLTSAGSHPADGEWRHVSLRLKNIGAGAVTADDAYLGFDLANITGGNLDSTWTTTDYTTCEASLNALWSNLSAYVPSYYTPVEYRWYRKAFNPYSSAKPFAPMGPPERVTPKGGAGAASPSQAAQVAMSITERTAWPKHWGRFYLPLAGETNFDTTGRIKTSVADAACTAVVSVYAALANAEFYPVIPVTQVGNVPARGLIGVTQIQVDTIPDVIRRRRLKQNTYKKLLP